MHGICAATNKRKVEEDADDINLQVDLRYYDDLDKANEGWVIKKVPKKAFERMKTSLDDSEMEACVECLQRGENDEYILVDVTPCIDNDRGPDEQTMEALLTRHVYHVLNVKIHEGRRRAPQCVEHLGK